MSLIGIIVNVTLAVSMNKLELHLFMDTVGTIAISAIGGLFPGILTAVVTNSICALFNVNYIYYGFMNAIVAILTAWYVRKYGFKKLWKVFIFILTLAVFSGSLSTWINWALLNGMQSARNSDVTNLIASSTGMTLFWAYFFYNILLNIFDKGVAVFIAWLLMVTVPQKVLIELEQGSWKQRPLDREEIDELNEWGKDLRHTMRLRTTLILIVTSVLLVIVTGWSGIRLYFSKVKESKTVDALNSVKLIAQTVDPEEIKDIVNNGRSSVYYDENKQILQKITNSYTSVEHMYMVDFDERQGRIIYDISSVEEPPREKKTILVYDELITPSLNRLFAGEIISPVEHGNINDWVRSVFYPLKDEEGKCLCYVIADVSVTYVADYMYDFGIRSILILLGFFILVLANNMWYTNILMVFPIRSMAKAVDDFSSLGYGQEQLDKNVKNIRALDIATEDEVEKLYKSICTMTLNLSEQMRDLRRLSEVTAKMQDGLIITMADMVERRDSDTGEHIQKTALYVKIIVEGLRKKGYYAGKINDKFISDVVRSAPLHDIGKINIPDGILNKPGKLTPEEFEIMKTHSTAGKKIMEDAISTVEGENYLKEARNMAAYHHERWDGKGYPEGLHGEVIPLSARIMAVADVFDALTSPRIYKPAFPLDKALSIITEEAGHQFDPKCVEVFLEALPEVKVILKKYNNM
ncbi:MAG: HD domain-containing protein [Butyrivibrio sp.]|nr:HD domain-containing protein [Butyrivibrio sp.]